MKEIYLSLFVILFISCSHLVTIPATQDVTISSHFPNSRINGKEQPQKGYGYGAKRLNDNGFVTYPVNYIGIGDSPYTKDAIAIGGFDLSNISGKIVHATLVLFVNYVSNTRKTVLIFVRPIKKAWGETQLTFLDVFKSIDSGAPIINFAETNEDNCKLVVCNFKEFKDSTTIPNSNSNQWIRIDVSSIVKNWQKNPGLNHGILIDPMWFYDIRYSTVDKHNKLANLGTIEIGCTEWLEWNGKVPKRFYLASGKWVKIKNNTQKKIKYIPHLEITTK